MLGFSAFSETAIGQAVTSAEANAFISGAQGTFSQGTLTFIAIANIQIPAATATGSVTTVPLVQGVGNSAITGATATSAAGSVEGDGQATSTLTGVSSTSAVSATTANGKANPVPTGASSTFTGGTLSFDAKANFTIPSVSSTITFGDFSDEDAQGTVTLTGVSATGTAAVNTDSSLNGGIYSNNITYLNTDFVRERCVNIVPYANYTVYIQKVSNY